MRFLLLAFIIIPLAEMLLLFEVAERIGGWSTLGLVVLTAVIGVQILKQQGLSTLTRANQRMMTGELPAQEMIEGLFLAMGGAFLLTPGFITDTLGFLCLIGPTRRMAVRWLIRSGKLAVWQAGGSRGFFYSNMQGGMQGGEQRNGQGNRPHGQNGEIMEGEYEREGDGRSDTDRLGKD